MGRIRDFFHPREAAVRFYREQEEELERQVREDIEREQRNLDCSHWADNEYHVGNPEDYEWRDREIARFTAQYPEVSSLEQEQRDFEAEAFDRGPNWSYPEYEGPGFTEPPIFSEEYHEDHPGWTLTEWALERGYAEERVDEINRQLPRDEAEEASWKRLNAQGEREAEEAGPFEYDGVTPYAEAIPEPEPGPAPVPPSLLRIVTMQKSTDDVWESPGHREIRGEPDPYDPLHFPDYSYWAPGREAAE
jgi:hypothetical protein